MPVPNSIAILWKLYGKSSVCNTSTKVPTYITHHFLQFLSVIFIHKWVMLSSHKKAPIFWSQGITAITLSLFIYFFLCFLIYPSWGVWLQTKILCDLSAWPLAIPGLCLAGPAGESCPLHPTLSALSGHCSQGLGLRHLHSEDSLLEASAEAPPRSFCQHLLIRGLSLRTFPHCDSVCLHS